MTIVETLIRLRDDLKTWVANNIAAKTEPISEEVDLLNTLVGDTPVSDQIANAINSQELFSGDYNDLENAPNIIEDNSGDVVISDSAGNVILKVDAEGVHTTAVEIDGEDVKTYIDSHAHDTVVHVTEAERNSWSNKSEFSGNYADLVGAPNISEDNSDNVIISDNAGNVVFMVDSQGVRTTAVTVGDGLDVESAIRATDEIVSQHTTNADIHITQEERESWFSGDYNELTNKPNVTEDNSDNITVADSAGNIVAQINELGLHTVGVTIGDLDVKSAITDNQGEISRISGLVGTTSVKSQIEEAVSDAEAGIREDLTKHTTDTDNPHGVTTAQIGAATEEALNQHIADKTNPHEVTYEQVGADKAGSAAAVQSAVQGNLDAHTADTEIHITQSERESWFSGDYNDLDNKPNITEDNSGSLYINDAAGNTIFAVNESGVSTTALSLNGEDVKTLIDSKADQADVVAIEGEIGNIKADVVAIQSDYLDSSDKADLVNQIAGAKQEAIDTILGETVDADFDTLQEVAAWIQADTTDSAKLIARVDTIEKDYLTSTDKQELIDADEQLSLDLTTHQTASDAHTDIRELADTAQETADGIRADFTAHTTTENPHKITTGMIGAATQSAFDAHTGNNEIHITDEERTTWNEKSDFSGNYNDLENQPNILEDNSDSFNISDSAGNIIFAVAVDGVTTTSLTTSEVHATKVTLNNVDLEETLQAKGAQSDVLALQQTLNGDGTAANPGLVEQVGTLSTDFANHLTTPTTDNDIHGILANIAVHNVANDAHSDIRQSVNNKADGSRVTAIETTLNGDGNDNVGLVKQVETLATDVVNKVDKVNDGSRLIYPAEITKLEKLVVDEDGNVGLSGTVSLENVVGLADELEKKVDKKDGFSLVSDTEIAKLATVAENAQVNIIDSVDSDDFEIDADKKLSIKAVTQAHVTGLTAALEAKAEKSAVTGLQSTLDDLGETVTNHASMSPTQTNDVHNILTNIATHNSSTDAHQDIRDAVAAAEIPITSTPDNDTYIWIDPEDDSTDISYSKEEIDALLSGKASTATYTATVTSTWTASDSYYYQDIVVDGILATDNPIVDINPGSDNAANITYSECICKVFRITTSANSIRVWATEAIASAFPIQLKVVR